MISNLGKADPSFSDEVDNTAGTNSIDNIAVIPLWLEDKTELVGVLQLVNYKNREVTSAIIIYFLL